MKNLYNYSLSHVAHVCWVKLKQKSYTEKGWPKQKGTLLLQFSQYFHPSDTHIKVWFGEYKNLLFNDFQ